MVKSESMTVTLQILNSRMFCIFFVETFRFAISIHACRTKYFTIDTGKQINMRYPIILQLITLRNINIKRKRFNPLIYRISIRYENAE